MEIILFRYYWKFSLQSLPSKNEMTFDLWNRWITVILVDFGWSYNGDCLSTVILNRDSGHHRKRSRYQNFRKKRHRIIAQRVIRSPKFKFASFSLIERNSECFPKLWRCLRSIFINIFLELSFFDLPIMKITRYTFILGESTMVHDPWTIWSLDIGMHWYHSQWFRFFQAA